MNISNWQHKENRKRAAALRAMGFELEVTADGYFVRFRGKGLGGASVILPRQKPLHYKHREGNLRDNLSSAIIVAERSPQYRELQAENTPVTA
jgi:hypothetical protein